MLTMIYLFENADNDDLCPFFVRSAGVTRGANVGLVEIAPLEQERLAVVSG
jgi:hypothetical protein